MSFPGDGRYLADFKQNEKQKSAVARTFSMRDLLLEISAREVVAVHHEVRCTIK
jgi:hypothetical protein